MIHWKTANCKRGLIVTALAVCLGVVCVVGVSQTITAPQGEWVAGDFHQHTTYTDGSNSMKTVMYKNNQFGLDWWANSEHGGSYATDARGPLTIDGPFNINGGSAWTDTSRYTVNPIIAGSKNMWRWQSIRDYSFWDVMEARALLSKVIVQGVEWNVPGHEHCSVGIIQNEWDFASPNATPVAQFEYLFDASDSDTSGGLQQGWTGKITTNNHAKALAAVEWMQKNHPRTSWMVPAHVERKQPPSLKGSGWDIQDFRDLNNAGPDVMFGFESMPGHQKEAGRGGYSTSAVGGGTYGGTGIYSAAVGGLWDALLGEGRAWWLFASSDFHATDGDFWPGEYQKTYTFVTDKRKPQAIVDGLRSGNSFVVEGDLIDKLDFRASSYLFANGKTDVTMGQTLMADRSGANNVYITIGFHSPEKNNNGDRVAVDHIDLIAGRITGKVAPGSANYNVAVNPTTQVIGSFSRGEWATDANGWSYIQFQANVSGDTYFRLRGTNQPRNTPGQTDAQGNPLLDPQNNDPQKAFADLWFYSNPIFVRFR
jgi:hypothetical protein